MTHERVDDVPLLLAVVSRMDLPKLFNRCFPTHGNWSGLPLGELAAAWLVHIVSQANHRLSHVQPWAERRAHVLSQSLAGFRVEDFSDDRLAAVLRYLQQDAPWQAFEAALSQRLLQVYELRPETIRLDSTTISWDVTVNEGGLPQFGHSKGPRRDLPILKLMQATLDPVPLPLVTTVVSGDAADDPLYVPAIQEVRQALGCRGLLYTGDCKMAAMQTRAFVAAGEYHYLCPLPEKQFSRAQLRALLGGVWSGEQALTPVERPGAEGEAELIAQGFEVSETVTGESAGNPLTWGERRLVVRSLQFAAAGTASLKARVQKAVTEITALGERKRGKRRPRSQRELGEAAEAILSRYHVAELIRLTYAETVQERSVRRHGAHPARVEVHREAQVEAAVDTSALEAAIRELGWRVYATNAPASRLPLAQVVLTYRDQYLIERAFGRLKGSSLSLSPMYLQRDDHATGLVRLLSVALRLLALVEFQVRRELAREQRKLTGLYPGNPKRASARPQAETLLKAFSEITLTTVTHPQGTVRYLTPLSHLQEEILRLLGLSPAVYTGLAGQIFAPT